MQITIRKPKKPTITIPKGKADLKGFSKQIDFFYNFEEYSKRNMPLSSRRLISTILISTVLTFALYFLTSYIRAFDLDNVEIAKQVLFLNYTLWAAFLLFVVGLNGLIILVTRAKNIEIKMKTFFHNQIYVAVKLFVMMRFVATVLILLDEKLPFEVSLNLRFFNFSLLTVLFVSQVLLILVGYNYLRLHLGEKIKKYPYLEMLIAVIYTASLWTLTSP